MKKLPIMLMLTTSSIVAYDRQFPAGVYRLTDALPLYLERRTVPLDIKNRTTHSSVDRRLRVGPFARYGGIMCGAYKFPPSADGLLYIPVLALLLAHRATWLHSRHAIVIIRRVLIALGSKESAA